jgi:hypothetical protein
MDEKVCLEQSPESSDESAFLGQKVDPQSEKRIMGCQEDVGISTTFLDSA